MADQTSGYCFTRKWLARLFFLLSIHPILAQDYWKRSYKTADKIAAKTEKTTNLNVLSENLTQNLPDTIDKFRAIFTWIALNISYDVSATNNPEKESSNPEEVILKGKSVCEGYANLFQALCEQRNLPCKTISGWTKNFPDKINEDLPRSTSHAWNAIKVDRQWFLCDVTWASGYLSEETNEFIKEFNPTYFCTPAKLFRLNHYPEKINWFLGDTLSKDYFINLPHFYSFALANNIQTIKPEYGIIKFIRGQEIQFSFTLDQSIHSVQIKPSEIFKPEPADFHQQNGTITFEYRLDRYSPFLYIYLNNQGAIVYKLKK